MLVGVPPRPPEQAGSWPPAPGCAPSTLRPLPVPDLPPQVEDKVRVALARGDAAAFDAIYAAYKDRILTVAYQVLGERPAADDVLQDVFLSLVRKPRCLLRAKSIRGYLLSMAVNRARDVLRRRRLDARRPTVPNSKEEAGPVATAAGRDEAAAIARLLSGLPPTQREVVVLHLYQDLTLREVAAIVGAPVNTVQSRFRYAIAALRRRIPREAVS